jgi:hypothetical protein
MLPKMYSLKLFAIYLTGLMLAGLALRRLTMTNNHELTQDQRQNLRVEYEVCQQVANNETGGYWAFAGIFLAFSPILLAGIIAGLFHKEYILLLGFVTTFLSLGMWIIYYSLWRMLKRANCTQRKAFDRMVIIEKSLGDIELRNNLDKSGIGIKGKGTRWYQSILIVLSTFWLIILVTIWIMVIARFIFYA